MVMILRVYGEEEALVIVRLQAGLRLETMRRGKSPAKNAMVVKTIAMELAVKARPKRLARIKIYDTTKANTAMPRYNPARVD